MSQRVAVFVGEALGRYRFPEGHPFSIDRQHGFWSAARNQGLDKQVEIALPRQADIAELARFHTEKHIELVRHQSRLGRGFLDYGDTPAFPGVFEAASTVAGSALEGAERILAGENRRTFQAVGGLHHARPEGAAGFCVFNDLGVLIRTLREKHGIHRIAYVDIDVHHGDGVFYTFEDDPHLIFADIHEDGRYIYPGTGDAAETGSGPAHGTKINLPLPPGATDRDFCEAWEQAFEHLRRHPPEFIILQCGADSLRGDPLAHLRLTPESHALAARTLCDLADEVCDGRLMAFGGGGYEPRNLAAAWCAVLEELVR
ncbi:MAG: acetoin utilization protein AcuC [Rhodocyclaceae bacterium]